MKVRELMTAQPVCADPDTTVEEIASLMKEENIGCVPIVDDDGQVAGMITDRDIVIRCIAEGKDPSECRADDIVSPQSVTINPNADAKEAARLMADRQIRRLAVVEHGKLVGMLSLGDVAVKQHDDRLSGDVLQDVSEGVKDTADASHLSAQGNTLRDEESLREDARPTSRHDSRRHEKVIPFRETGQTRDSAHPPAGRSKSGKKAG